MTKRRHSALSVLAGVGIVVGAAVILFSRWANSPTSVVGTAQVPTGVVEGESIELAKKVQSNNYFSAEIPISYQLKSSSEQPAGPILSQSLFSGASGAPGTRIADQLGITVGLLPSEGLPGVSAVMMRSRMPDSYTALQFDWLPQEAKAFSKSGSELEVGVFMANAQRYAAVVASGSIDRREAFEQILKDIITSWQWK